MGILLCCAWSLPSTAGETPTRVADIAVHIEVPAPIILEEKVPEREPIVFEVSAYTLAAEECNKSSSDPAYGITASGKHVEPWRTIAAGKSYPFGTLIYLPYFKNYPNGGVFRVEDRGGYITDSRIDVFMESTSEANKFGRRDLKGYIITEEELQNGTYQTKCKN